MKIVINRCYGGFGFSDEVAELYISLCKAKGQKPAVFPERNDPFLIEAIEQLGDEANTAFSRLKIVEIPNDVNWTIHEYDGMETVREVAREWY